MVADVERQDLLSVFTDNKTMLYEEEEEIIRNLGDARDRLLTRFTREQVTDLLNSVELDEDGGASFHDLQKLILEIRDSRIQACKVMYPGLTGSKGVRTKSKKVRSSRIVHSWCNVVVVIEPTFCCRHQSRNQNRVVPRCMGG